MSYSGWSIQSHLILVIVLSLSLAAAGEWAGSLLCGAIQEGHSGPDHAVGAVGPSHQHTPAPPTPVPSTLSAVLCG